MQSYTFFPSKPKQLSIFYYFVGKKATIKLILYIWTQRHKETKIIFRYKDNKRLKSRHKALRMEIFVAFVKADLSALCIFRLLKWTLSLCLFVFK